MSKFQTHYDNLQVGRNAEEEIIRAAYRTLSQKYHPDKNLDAPELANKRMKLINRAYEVLNDPARRAEHDAWIRANETEELDRQTAETAREQDLSRMTAESNKARVAKRRSTLPVPREGHEASRPTVPLWQQAIDRTGVTGVTKTAAGTTSGEWNGLHFIHVLLLCLVYGWWHALTSPIGGRLLYDKAPFLGLLFDMGAWGLALAPAMILMVVVSIGWVVGWLVRPWRTNASWIALLLGLVVCVALEMGSIQKGRHEVGGAVPPAASSPALPLIAMERAGGDAGDADIKKFASQMTAKLPIRNDIGGTTIVKVFAETGRTLVYQIVDDMPADQWTNAMRSNQIQMFVNNYCTNPSMSYLHNINVKIKYMVFDTTWTYLYGTTVSAGNCR
ncbi:MAG: J domain-containing protein [Burkholderiaceae bacterium]|nr:J domain-containing protein [Burkholderiaceae bacterium]